MFTSHYVRRVEWGDCDPAQIVYNPRYFAFFDTATGLLFEAAGWRKPDLLTAFDIVGLPVVDIKATFLAPCTFGDEVTITSRVTACRRSSFDVAHQLRRGDLLCVEGTETRVWTIKDPDNPGRLKSAPLPAEVIARLEADGPAA